MKSAARSVSSSQSLKDFAAKLKEGSYAKAGGELKKLANQLKKGEISPDAKEFDSVAADLQRMAEQMASDQEMQGACENGAKAASSMSKEALAEALKRLAEQMEKNADKMGQCDKMGDYQEMLERLKRMMNQCKGNGDKPGFGDGEGDGEGGRRAGKGGLKPGWGTAAKWDGGSLTKQGEQRMPDLATPQERPGMSSTFQVVSPNEKAQSGKKYEEMYAEFVQKSEADLDLDSVPVACRDYLRRYFNAIKPQEGGGEGPEEERAKPPLPK
jgi:hypothetical protein